MGKKQTGSVFPFITGRPLWVNVLAAIVLSLLAILLFFQTLDWLTNHGEYLKVPDVKNKPMVEASRMLEEQGFDVIVQDSVYYDTLAPGAVFRQFPDPGATVKVNRTLYLTVNRVTAPLVDMPNLVGMSFRNAELELYARGLKLGDTSYVPDIAKNAVKEQIMNGVPVKPGARINMGTEVSLVLGAGIGSESVAVPNLFGLPYIEALTLMEANGIIPGVILPDPDLSDTTAGFVYWQSPERFNQDRKLNRIRQGQMMDIRLSVTRPEVKTDSVAPKPPEEQEF